MGHIESFVIIYKHSIQVVNMGTMVGIDLVKGLVNFVFKFFDGYITGSLGPAGSQIRKKEILNNFFYFYRALGYKNYSYGTKIKASKSGLRIFITKKTHGLVPRQVKPGAWPILR